MDRLIVDGYNVTHAWPSLKQLMNVSLEEARDRATEAIRGHLKVLRKYREPIPRERSAALRRPIAERLRIALPV